MRKHLNSKLRLLLLSFGFLLGLLLAMPQQVHATGANFTLAIQEPKNQIDQNTGYFNVLVEPKQEQKLTVVVNNLSDQQNTITIRPVSAYTNGNGIVAYRRRMTPRYSSASYHWTDLIIEKKQTVVIPAGGQASTTFTLKIPDTSIAGLIDGGFRATSNQSDTQTVQKGFKIRNKYALIMGATAQMSKTYVSPELKLNKVKPGLVANTTTLLANIENTEPSLFGEMTIDAKVTKRGSDKVLHSAKRSNLSMAPMSNFNYQIDWNREPFKVGKYTLHLTAKSGVKTWRFTRNFTIASAKADKVNKKAVNLKKPNYWWLWLLLLLLLLLIIWFVIWKRRKKDDEDETATEDNVNSDQSSEAELSDDVKDDK